MNDDGSEMRHSPDWTQRSLCDDPSWLCSNAPTTPSPAVPPAAMLAAMGARPSSCTPSSAVSAAGSPAAVRRTVARVQLPLFYADTSTTSTEPDGPQLQRPKTRAECSEAMRPCPWVSCRHHLLITESNGRLRLNRPTGTRRPSLRRRASDLEVELWTDDAVETLQRMGETCALDVADEVGAAGRKLGQCRLGRLLGTTPSGAREEFYRAEASLRLALGQEDKPCR